MSTSGAPASRAELFEAFAADLRALGKRPRTIESYLYRLQDFASGLGARSLIKAGRNEVRRYHDRLRKEGFSASTAKSRLATLRVFYRFLLRRGWIESAPAIELPRVPRNPPVHVLTSRQVLRILAQPALTTPTGVRDRALLEVLYSTGIRLGELRGLHIEHLDFAGGFVHVAHGKGGKWRIVPVGTTALAWTRRYLDEVRPEWVPGSAERAVFLSHRGRPLGVTTIQQRIVRRYAEKARIPFRVTPHAFRHASATHLLRGDGQKRRAGLVQVRDILGHTSADTTRLYTRVEIRDLESVLCTHHFRDRRRR